MASIVRGVDVEFREGDSQVGGRGIRKIYSKSKKEREILKEFIGNRKIVAINLRLFRNFFVGILTYDLRYINNSFLPNELPYIY